MKVINKVNVDLNEEVGGIPFCILGCGVLCYGTSGAGTVVASGAYLL